MEAMKHKHEWFALVCVRRCDMLLKKWRVANTSVCGRVAFHLRFGFNVTTPPPHSELEHTVKGMVT